MIVFHPNIIYFIKYFLFYITLCEINHFFRDVNIKQLTKIVRKTGRVGNPLLETMFYEISQYVGCIF